METPKVTMTQADTETEIYTVLTGEQWTARSFAIFNPTEYEAVISILYNNLIIYTETLAALSVKTLPGIATTLIVGDILEGKSTIVGITLQANLATLLVSSGGSTAWADITGKPTVIVNIQSELDAKAAVAHGHVITDVTDLKYTLDTKAHIPEGE